MKFEEYLKESTVAGAYAETGPKAISGDDDFPTGNIIMGDKYKKTGYYNRLTNFNINWVPDDADWKWDAFGSTAAQSSTQAYNDSLLAKGKYSMSDRLFKHMNTGENPDVPRSSRLLGGDIGPFTDAWGNPKKGDEYEKTGDEKETEKIVKQAEKPGGWAFKPKVVKDVIKKINGLL